MFSQLTLLATVVTVASAATVSTGTVPLNGPCEQNSDCQSNSCFFAINVQGGVCECKINSDDCSYPNICSQVSGFEHNYCLPSSGIAENSPCAYSSQCVSKCCGYTQTSHGDNTCAPAGGWGVSGCAPDPTCAPIGFPCKTSADCCKDEVNVQGSCADMGNGLTCIS
eukprot:Pgem_evm1s13376